MIDYIVSGVNTSKDSVESVRDLIKGARSSISIYDPSLNPELYQNKELVQIIKIAVEYKRIPVEIICNSDAPITNPDLEKLIEDKKISLYRTDTRLENHASFMVIDNRHVRLEKPEKDPLVFFHPLFLGNKMQKTFDKLKSSK